MFHSNCGDFRIFTKESVDVVGRMHLFNNDANTFFVVVSESMTKRVINCAYSGTDHVNLCSTVLFFFRNVLHSFHL